MRASLALLLAVLAAVAAGCGSSSSSSSSSSTEAPSPEAGATSTVVGSRDVKGQAVLVDSDGRTLYTFARGVKCTGTCATDWPPLVADGEVSVKKGSGVDEKLLGTVRRGDGTMQVTYDDKPLYRFADDAPGESRGSGSHAFGGAWDVARVSSNPFKREKTKGPSCEPDCGY